MVHIMQQYHLTANTIKKLQKKKKEIKVLEIGCGDGGVLTKHLAAHFTSIQFTGIDFHTRNHQYNNAKFIRGKYPHSSIKETFDIIMLFNTFPLNTSKEFLNQLNSQLNKKGYLLITSCAYLTSKHVFNENLQSTKVLEKLKTYTNELSFLKKSMHEINLPHHSEVTKLLQLIKLSKNRKELRELLEYVKHISTISFEKIASKTKFKLLHKDPERLLQIRYEHQLKYHHLYNTASKATEYILKKKEEKYLSLDIHYPNIFWALDVIIKRIEPN